MRVNPTFQEAICPYIETLNRVLTDQVIGYFEPGFEFKIETSEPLSEKVTANLAISLYQGGSITLNQARRRIGVQKQGSPRMFTWMVQKVDGDVLSPAATWAFC